MAASTVTALPHSQWMLMNRLTSRTGRPATPMLARCDATVDDLVALAERELIVGKVHDGDVDLGLLAHDRGALAAFDIQLLLSAAGVRWVEKNPSNQALIAVEVLGGHGRAKLTAAAKQAGVDPPAFLLLHHAGLVVLTYEDGTEASPGTLTLRAFATQLHVQLTPLGRNLIN